MAIRLVEPTDFIILDSLTDGERNVAANLAKMLEMGRSYVNTWLSILADHNLVERIGPEENSGIYQITPLGVAASRHQALHGADLNEFEAKIRTVADDVTLKRPVVIKNP